jgi:uncharacterized YkwD family protein
LVSTLAMSSIIGAGVASASSNTVMDNNTLWTILQQNGINLSSPFQSIQQITNGNNFLSDLLKTFPNTNTGNIPFDVPNNATPNTSTPKKYTHKTYTPNTSTPNTATPNTSTPNTSTPNTSTPNTATQDTSTQSAFATEVFNLVNQERSKAGLNTLAINSALSGMALDKAKDLYNNNYFDHNSPTYGSPFDMMKTYGIQFTYAGENIAKGQQTPQEVMTAWMNSQGHRDNILNPHFTKIGVAFYNGEWVQEFIAN